MRRRLCNAALLLALCLPAIAARAGDELPLLGGRFVVTAEWETAGGATGTAEAVPLTTESGLFWFFSPTNIELVVKLLDACAPYGRFWFFASGLTDVAVTLTVEDRWTGQQEVYHHAAGELFQPFADTASLAGCGATSPACGQGVKPEIDASPRPDAEAEMLALLLGGDAAADATLYQRFHADLAAIRALEPALANVTFQNVWWEPAALQVGFDAAAHAEVLAGTYDEWDCLNQWYRGTLTHVSSFPNGYLTFAGMLHPFRIAPDYAALAGITYAEPSFLAWPSGGPPPTPRLCAIADGVAFDYIFEVPGQFAHYWSYYRVAAPGAPPQHVGDWDGSALVPPWAPRVDECFAALEQAAVPNQDGPSTASVSR